MIVRPNDTLVLALEVEAHAWTKDQFVSIRDEIESLLGNNIRVIPIAGIKESFIVRSDET